MPAAIPFPPAFFVLVALAGCAPPTEDSAASEDTAMETGIVADTGTPDPAPLVADEAVGTLGLDSGVYLVSTISDRNGDSLTDLLLSDGRVVPVPTGSAGEADVVIQTYGGPWPSYPYLTLWAARDLDGDGVSEIAAWYSDSGQYLYVGLFPASATTLDPAAELWGDTVPENWQTATTGAYLVDDVSGDALPDLEFVMEVDPAYVVQLTILQPPTTDSSEWTLALSELTYQPVFWEAQFVGLDDVDGDGLRDVAEEDEGALWLWSGNVLDEREDDAPLAVLTPAGDHGGVWNPRSADADADGRTDLVIYGATEADVVLAPAAGALTEADALARWQLETGDTVRWVGDQDGNGMQELVVQHESLLLTLAP